MNAEQERLKDVGGNAWRKWGTYLPERQWGTVREDRNGGAQPWSFSYDDARETVFQWGEDGILGWTDDRCHLCFSLSLWNGKDVHLKERFFGLTNEQGNHGEDVKELFFYLDATPTSSYAKALYKYPQGAFPYDELRDASRSRTIEQREFELLDTGVFDSDRYFDVVVEYAKRSPDDLQIQITVSNRSEDDAEVWLIPTLVFRNTWSTPAQEPGDSEKPEMIADADNVGLVHLTHPSLGRYRFTTCGPTAPKELVFTDNESVGDPKAQTGSKRAFDRYVVHGERGELRHDGRGTKCGYLHHLWLRGGETSILQFRLTSDKNDAALIDSRGFATCLTLRRYEADCFYREILPESFTAEEKLIARQALAGLIWTKQFYYFVSRAWLRSAVPTSFSPSPNDDWPNLYCHDVLSMPDKWEYPWFAAWDLALQMIPMAIIDLPFAKGQLLKLLSEWYQHPNGQLPAYEISFSDVNPPVYAWATLLIYLWEKKAAKPDLVFLEKSFQKLTLYFTWWMNRTDAAGHGLFAGGFLGLDNVGVFNRSERMPAGEHLNQADGTAWMGMFCSAMLKISAELAVHNDGYEDMTTRFLHHYLSIVDAFNSLGGNGLWDEQDGFYYDQLQTDAGPSVLRIRSITGFVPLFAVNSLQKDQVEALPQLRDRLRWLVDRKPEIAQNIASGRDHDDGSGGGMFISLVPRERLVRLLRYLFDEDEFFSPFGIRSLSKVHAAHPFTLDRSGTPMSIGYAPDEGNDHVSSRNSNWRGPVWMPLNTLIIHSLDLYYEAYGDDLLVEVPTRSGKMMTLKSASEELTRRLVRLFEADDAGVRPCHGTEKRYSSDPHWRDLLLFYEHFSGETGRGLGASHQTGWTALIVTCLMQLHSA